MSSPTSQGSGSGSGTSSSSDDSFNDEDSAIAQVNALQVPGRSLAVASFQPGTNTASPTRRTEGQRKVTRVISDDDDDDGAGGPDPDVKFNSNEHSDAASDAESASSSSSEGYSDGRGRGGGERALPARPRTVSRTSSRTSSHASSREAAREKARRRRNNDDSDTPVSGQSDCSPNADAKTHSASEAEEDGHDSAEEEESMKKMFPLENGDDSVSSAGSFSASESRARTQRPSLPPTRSKRRRTRKYRPVEHTVYNIAPPFSKWGQIWI